MLSAFNQLFASIWVLFALLVFLVGPFVLAWILFSIRRDIHRIADAAQHMSGRFDMVTHDEVTGQMKQLEPIRARVSNSMFGR